MKHRVLEVLRKTEQTRYSREFLRRPEVRDRFRSYFRASLRELDRLRSEHGLDLPVPSSVVFGHTHQPIPWGSDELVDAVDGRRVRFCNTGGFLLKDEPDGSTNLTSWARRSSSTRPGAGYGPRRSVPAIWTRRRGRRPSSPNSGLEPGKPVASAYARRRAGRFRGGPASPAGLSSCATAFFGAIER
jgi:hypothetical protein